MDVLPYKLQYNRFVEHEHITHYNRLKTQKTVLNTSVPESFSSAHASFRGARACWEVEHNRQIIAAENGKLIESMTKIMSSPIIKEKRIIIKSRNETGQKMESARITIENRKLADRLEKMRPLTPSLSVQQLEEHSRISSVYCKNAAKIGRRTMSPLNLKIIPRSMNPNSSLAWHADRQTDSRKNSKQKNLLAIAALRLDFDLNSDLNLNLGVDSREGVKLGTSTAPHTNTHQNTHTHVSAHTSSESNAEQWSGYTSGEDSEKNEHNNVRTHKSSEEDFSNHSRKPRTVNRTGSGISKQMATFPGTGNKIMGLEKDFSLTALSSVRAKIINKNKNLLRNRPWSSKIREKEFLGGFESNKDLFLLTHSARK